MTSSIEYGRDPQAGPAVRARWTLRSETPTAEPEADVLDLLSPLPLQPPLNA